MDNAAENWINDHRGAVPCVIGSHDSLGAAILEAHPEGHAMLLPEEALVEVRRRTGAEILIAVGKEVLEQCGRLPVLRVVTLKALDKGNGHGSVKERVFTADFLTASPAGVARQVRLRSPEHQDLAVILGGLGDVARFVSLDTRGLTHQVRVP